MFFVSALPPHAGLAELLQEFALARELQELRVLVAAAGESHTVSC
jgi:hypothetical protein